jgi:Flp pilus assembly pilin Flp
MNTFIQNFLKDEDGAVTVDWVVLTAAVVGLGIAGVTAVNNGIGTLAESIGTEVGGITVAAPDTLGFSGAADGGTATATE